MRLGVIVFAAISVAGALTACGEGDDATTLDGTSWAMDSITIDGTATPALAEAIVTAVFSGGKVSGDMGCNLYDAAYTRDGDAISFEDPALTGAACPVSDAVTDQANAFVATFFAAERVEVSDDLLTLANAAGDELMRFVPAEPLPLDGIRWRLTGFAADGGFDAPLADTEITLTFLAAGTLEGSAGCNTYFGEYSVDGTGLDIGPVAATERGCLDPVGVMEQETAYLGVVSRVEAFRPTLSHLELLNGAGDVVAEYRFSGRA